MTLLIIKCNEKLNYHVQFVLICLQFNILYLLCCEFHTLSISSFCYAITLHDFTASSTTHLSVHFTFVVPMHSHFVHIPNPTYYVERFTRTQRAHEISYAWYYHQTKIFVPCTIMIHDSPECVQSMLLIILFYFLFRDYCWTVVPVQHYQPPMVHCVHCTYTITRPNSQVYVMSYSINLDRI